VIGLDWQDADPTAYDPDNPLALLEKAAAAEGIERATSAVRAVRSMLAGGADAGVMAVAREFVKNTKVLAVASFDDIAREVHGDDAGRDDPERKSAATSLVELAQEFYTFGISDTGEPFALPADGPKVVAMLRGGKTSLRALLAREYFTRTGKAATQQALADALLVIEGIAQDAEESRLYLRAAQHEGALWLDLGDHTGRAVQITRDGWTVRDSAPVLFKRTALTGPVPEPQPGGTLGDLWEWLNVAEDDRPLVVAALVSVLFTDQPHVVLAIFGEQGTGKTTAVKVLVLILDPGPGAGTQATTGRRRVGDRGGRVVGGQARQPVRHPVVAVRLAVPRLDRRRRCAPQAVVRLRLCGVRVPPLHHLRRDRRRRARARPCRPGAAGHSPAHPG
jgi:hypothetical protein